MVTDEQLGATVVEDDDVVFRLPDPEHARPGVRLWCDVEIQVDDEVGGERELQPVDGGWELRLPIPPLDCLEYMFEVDGSLELDPTNPRQVDGAFGPHSWLSLPGYDQPSWLDHEEVASVRRPVRVDRTPVGRIEAQVWQPADAHSSDRLPLLITHDGPEMDRFGRITQYAGAMIASGGLPPMRVALLAPGPRDERYAANPAYAAALTQRVVPRLLRRFPSDHRPVLCGQSLGGVATLHAAWEAPDMFAGLLLQSGSFFTADLDPQESGYSRFGEVTGFVSSVHEASEAPPGFPATAITCGTAEENLGNNHHMAATLSRYGVDVSWGEARQGHTWTCWRDLLDPHLTRLLEKVWR